MNNPIIVSDDVRNIAYAYNRCVVLSKQIIDYDDKYYCPLPGKIDTKKHTKVE